MPSQHYLKLLPSYDADDKARVKEEQAVTKLCPTLSLAVAPWCYPISLSLSSHTHTHSDIFVPAFFLLPRALYSKLSDTTLYAGKSLTLFFNLIYKSLKADPSSVRVLSMCKRLLHTALHVSSPVLGGALFLTSSLIKARPGGEGSLLDALGTNVMTIFDASKREPLHALGEERAASGTLWEVSTAKFHFHPSVRKFAETLAEPGGIVYTGDPLRDFQLLPFLDRFAFRNPKSREKLKKEFRRGESVAERKSGGRGLSVVAGVAVNDPAFLRSRAPAGEEFFYRFFAERARRDVIKGITRGGKEVTDEKERLAVEDAEVDAFGDVDNDDKEWEEDPEEAAFAQELAEQMMDKQGNGKANFDDEDPDTEGWDDMYGDDDDDDDDDEDGGDGDENADDDDEERDMFGGDDDDDDDDDEGGDGDDTFMDADSDDDEEELEKDGDDEDSEDDADENDSDDDDDDDDDDDNGGVSDAKLIKMAMEGEDSDSASGSDSDDASQLDVESQRRLDKERVKRLKKIKEAGTFASSEDVSELKEDDYWASRDRIMADLEREEKEIKNGAKGKRGGPTNANGASGGNKTKEGLQNQDTDEATKKKRKRSSRSGKK